MTTVLEELAKELDIPANDLLKYGMLAYLEHELRLYAAWLAKEELHLAAG